MIIRKLLRSKIVINENFTSFTLAPTLPVSGFAYLIAANVTKSPSKGMRQSPKPCRKLSPCNCRYNDTKTTSINTTNTGKSRRWWDQKVLSRQPTHPWPLSTRQHNLLQTSASRRGRQCSSSPNHTEHLAGELRVNYFFDKTSQIVTSKYIWGTPREFQARIYEYTQLVMRDQG